MNQELKTLNEIWESGKQSYSYGVVQGVGLDDLREEIIKWIKAFDLKMGWANETMKSSSSCLSKVARLSPKPKRELTKQEEENLKDIFEQSFRVGLMRIFNITEADLKNGKNNR